MFQVWLIFNIIHLAVFLETSVLSPADRPPKLGNSHPHYYSLAQIKNHNSITVIRQYALHPKFSTTGRPMARNYQGTATPCKNISLLLLILSGDVSLNPGPPTKYPCITCNKAVTYMCPAVQCDNCNLWVHNHCSGLSDSQYQNYIEISNLTFLCPNCHFPTFLKHFMISSSDIETSNRFGSLTLPTPENSLSETLPSINSPSQFRPAPTATSTPLRDRKKQRKTAKKFILLTVNCNSLQGSTKRAEFQAIIAEHQPHVVLGQESKLSSEHTTSEVFPDNYNIIRKDRSSGGGGVFIMIRNDIEFIEDAFADIPSTNVEIAWAQIKLPNSKILNLASIYRPPDSKLDMLKSLHQNISKVYSKFKNAQYILGGDLNLSCIDWSEGKILSNNHGTQDRNHCEQFIEILNDFGLSQHSHEVTRPCSDKILDLILTNTPNSVLETKSLPGMSDHNIVKASFSLILSRLKQTKRKIVQYNRADWN